MFDKPRETHSSTTYQEFVLLGVRIIEPLLYYSLLAPFIDHISNQISTSYKNAFDLVDMTLFDNTSNNCPFPRIDGSALIRWVGAYSKEALT